MRILGKLIDLTNMAGKFTETTTINISLWEPKAYYEPGNNLKIAKYVRRSVKY